MVEIFRTNVETTAEAGYVLRVLNTKFPEYIMNFDLEDCDRILRVKAEAISATEIENQLIQMGYKCDVLEDTVYESDAKDLNSMTFSY